jgi:hypothetical protein
MSSKLMPAIGLVAALAALAVAGSGQPSDQVVERAADRALVDWTAGLVTARGASAADLQTPDPTVARIRAERIARNRARVELARAARSLRLASGGSVEDRAARDRDVGGRLDRAVEAAADHHVEYGSDGSVEVSVALPIETVRQAVDGVAGPPELAGPKVSAVVVDAGRALAGPRLGVALRVGDQRYAGPSVYYRGTTPAMTDARLGAHVQRVRATALEEGDLVVAPGDIAAWRQARPLIVIALRGGSK